MRNIIMKTMLKSIGVLILVAFVATALPACETMPAAESSSASTADYTGSLRPNTVAIGGETTGWVLKRKGEPDLEVDVANIRTEAESLAGLLVRLRGRVQQRTYVERGKVPVLVAERIELAN